MDFFNDKWIQAMKTGKYYCPKCNNLMIWEDEYEEVLICLKCGYQEPVDHYGFTDEEYESLYPSESDLKD